MGNKIEKLIAKYEDKSQDILDMVKFARHIHVAGEGNNIDICKKCGHDIRHGIHFRYGENINEYTVEEVKASENEKKVLKLALEWYNSAKESAFACPNDSKKADLWQALGVLNSDIS